MIYPAISVTNNSTVVSDDEIKNALPAFQYQVTYHFRPFWDSNCHLAFTGKTPASNTWQIDILDTSDQPGALGYHLLNQYDLPLARVFAGTDKQYGLSWQITLSHELLEALADPYINIAAQTDNDTFYGYEVGDPVEADSLGYQITTPAGVVVSVSDFILPSWFQPELAGKVSKYDFKRHLTQPLQLMPEGYASIYKGSTGWTSVQMQNGELVEVAPDPNDPRFRFNTRVSKQ